MSHTEQYIMTCEKSTLTGCMNPALNTDYLKKTCTQLVDKTEA